jgi:hypothetical protein
MGPTVGLLAPLLYVSCEYCCLLAGVFPMSQRPIIRVARIGGFLLVLLAIHMAARLCEKWQYITSRFV